MPTVTLRTSTGADKGQVELDDEIFGLEPNVPVMHQVVVAQLAAKRAGTQSTKTRSEVSGGGAKPFKQKGTGRARAGSIRAPQWRGGGIALGPKPRKYDQKTPKKMVKAALRSALSDRASEGKIVVVDSWGFESPRTKDAKEALDALGITGTALVVVGRDDVAAALSFRNLPKAQVIAPGELNAYDVLCNEWIIFTKDVLPANTPVSATEPTQKQAAAEKPAVAAESAKATTSPAAAEGSASDEAGDSADQESAAPTSGEAQSKDESAS